MAHETISTCHCRHNDINVLGSHARYHNGFKGFKHGGVLNEMRGKSRGLLHGKPYDFH